MDTTVDPLFKKGFEIGYWLRKGNNPMLRDILNQNNKGSFYHDGLTAGKEEAERELAKFLSSNFNKSRSKGRER